MNLDKAYETWGQLSDNRELYYKTKTLFRKMWWLIPTNKPCSYYTLPVLARALQQANGAHSDKVSAASVMVHVLNFANSVNNDNPKPSFVFQDILDYTGEHPSMEQTIERIETDRYLTEAQSPIHIIGTGGLKSPEVKVKPAAKAKREGELARRAGTVPKSVVQLDPDTLKPVKVWPSCFAAQKELGIKNVQRAIVRHGISGGFYWCRPGDEEDFKPMDKRANNRAPKKSASKREKNDACISSSEREQARRDNGKADTDKPKPLTKEQKELHRKVFDDARGGVERQPTPEQQEQLKEAEVAVAEARQEFEEEIANHVEGVLLHCTQDELIAELRRRQWKGTLHITQTIEL